jgi:hypothetical protein
MGVSRLMTCSSAITKLKVILIIDLIIVCLAAVGYYYIQKLTTSTVKAEFQVTSISITPAEAIREQPVVILVNVTNVGNVPSVFTLDLKVNGTIKETKAVEIESGESKIVEFVVTESVVGEYVVQVGGLTGKFKIIEIPSTPSTGKSAVISANRLTINPTEEWPGGSIKISVDLTNYGDGKGFYQLTLKINGETRESKTIELLGGQSTKVEFVVTESVVGEYVVQVGGLTGKFKIVPKGMHTLHVSAGQAKVDFKIDGQSYKTPCAVLLSEGKHIISMPPTDPDGKYVFLHWEDGSKDPTRTITLTKEMWISATYSGGSSCPSLFVWNGTGYVYVAEVSNHGWLGYMNYITNDPEWPIVYWRNNPWDYLKLDKNQLQLVNGSHYELVLSQKWDEIFYLDAACLVVVDHPANVDVYSTGVEQYLDPGYMGKIYTVSKNPLAPIFAINEKGEDVLPLILHRDGVFTPGVNGLLSPSWDNILWNRLTLNLGDLSGAEQIKLIVTGKVDWGSPDDYTAWVEKFFANEVPNGTQITPQPYMEVIDGNGNWVMVPWERQFPLPPDVNSRTWVVDLTGLFPADNYWIRISNFWNVTFDYIGIDVTPQEEVIIYRIDPCATLYQEFESPSASYGNFTRYGDVTLLVLSYDDEFVIGRQGDAVRLIFPVNNLPPPAEGMERDFFFFVACWFKDPAGNWGYGFDFTADPLPFQNMSGFPYPLNKENYPYELHWNYLIEYNTRTITP